MGELRYPERRANDAGLPSLWRSTMKAYRERHHAPVCERCDEIAEYGWDIINGHVYCVRCVEDMEREAEQDEDGADFD